MSCPVVLATEALACFFRVLTSRHETMKLVRLQMAVIDMPVEVNLNPESFTTIWIRALVFLGMVALMMPRNTVLDHI